MTLELGMCGDSIFKAKTCTHWTLQWRVIWQRQRKLFMAMNSILSLLLSVMRGISCCGCKSVIWAFFPGSEYSRYLLVTFSLSVPRRYYFCLWLMCWLQIPHPEKPKNHFMLIGGKLEKPLRQKEWTWIKHASMISWFTKIPFTCRWFSRISCN